MIRSTPLSAPARAFLDRVDAHLRDLPPSEHAELLADVEARLAELDDDRGPTDVLGDPATFADDLRQAAGLALSAATGAGPATPLATWLRAQARRRPIAATLDYVRSLRPAWWALRGFLLVTLGLVAAGRPEHWGLHTLGFYSEALQARAVHASGGFPLWFLLVALAVAASVVLGRATDRLRPPVRLAVVALDVLAVFVLVAWPTWWLAPSFAYVTGLAG